MAWNDLYKNELTGELGKHWPLHAGQLEVLTCKARYVAAIGGVGSGKTVLGCIWLINEIARLGGDKEYLVVGPKYDIVTTATMDAWEATVKGTIFEGTEVRGSTNPHYVLGTGGKIYFRSANADFDGNKPWAALLDEGGNCDFETFRKIQRRLAGRSGRMCISTTPYLAYDWLQTDFIARADSEDTSYFYRTFASVDNPTFSIDDLEEAKKTAEPWEIEMYYFGRFTKPPGQVFNLTDRDGKSVAVDYTLPELKLDQCSGVYAGIDWGGADPTAIVVAALYPDRSLTVFHESYRTGQDISQVIATLRDLDTHIERLTGHKIKCLFCDHSPDRIFALHRSDWRGRVVPVKKGPQSIPVGISLVRSRFRSGAIRIVKGQCPNLLRELNMCRYPCVNGRAAGDKPIPGNDHAIDALSYMVRSIDRKQFDTLARLYFVKDKSEATDLANWIE